MSKTHEFPGHDSLGDTSFNDLNAIQSPESGIDGYGVPNDLLDLYFKQMGEINLLTAEEEVELAQTIEAGEEARTKLEAEGGNMTEAEQADIKRVAAEGQVAFEHFVSANLRLVVSIAAQFNKKSTLDLHELVQEGNLGLIKAVDRFDWRRGFKFSTYATWWIRQSIQRGSANMERVIRLPVAKHTDLMKVSAASWRLESEMGREPTDGEIAAATNLTEEAVRDIRETDYAMTSLDQPAGHDGRAELGEFVAVADKDPAQEVVNSDFNEWLYGEAAEILDERSWYVLVRHYGLDGEKTASMEVIGRELGLSRETVRKTENLALEKLRHKLGGLEALGAA